MTESQEQELLFQWADLKKNKYVGIEYMFHIPNEGKRSVAYAMKLKKMGVKPGVPDIFLPVPMCGSHGLFIEMKRAQGGRLSHEQSEYLKALRDFGYQAVICNGFDSAIGIIDNYMEGRL